MGRFTALLLAAAFVAVSTPADAQSRRQDRRDRQDIARAQGIPPGQMPPASQCRVWYDDRSNGRQPAPTSCARAEAIAARDRNARVVYGEDAYFDRRDNRFPDDDRVNRYPDNDRAVPRGRDRDPQWGGSTDDRYDQQAGSVGFRNGYRDGLTKGREDAEDGDRFDASRHSWYRSATRGYESKLGTRYEYVERYRAGFEAGYARGYRVYRRR